MKSLLIIPILITQLCYGQAIPINNIGTAIRINAPGQPSTVTINASSIIWPDSATMDDDGYYNGFPMVADAFGDTIVGMEKKASGHAPAGPMTFLKSVDKGNTWTRTPVMLDGDTLITMNYSFNRLSSGRMVICFRNQYTYSNTTIAVSDDGSANFTTVWSQNIDSLDTYNAYNSPNKIIETSFGKLFIVFYRVPVSSYPTEGVIYESADQGGTWAYKSTIFSHNSYPVTNETLGDWQANETAICETHPTGNESTSKFISLARTRVADIGGTYPQHFTSADGGNTWTTDLVNRDPGSFVDDNGVTISNSSPGFSRHLLYSFIGTNSPFDIRLHNGLVYVANGERNRVGSNKYALKYITATPDGAFQNKWDNWARPIQVGPYYNAITLGATIDCGYPSIFKANNKLYVAQYDVSTQAAEPLKAETRDFTEIYKLTY